MLPAKQIMRKAAFFALCSLTTIGVLAGSTARVQNPDLSTPEATIRSFVTAFIKPDFKLAARHVKDIKLAAEASQWEAMLREAKLEVNVLEVSTSKGAGGSLLATCKLSMKDRTGQSQTETSKIGLQQVGESWLIIQPETTLEMNRDPLQSFVVMLGSPSTIFTTAKESAKRTACMSNLKQIAIAALMFAGDNDDVLRLSGSNMAKKLNPYTKNNKIFDCPSHSGKAPSYSFNGALAGKSLAAVSKPAQTVMFYEGAGGKLDFSRHGGTANVAFCDGHVKGIKKGEEKGLRWKL